MARLGPMCGIVGYAGSVRTACGRPLEVCLKGLERLEYRGYDSAGVALAAPGMARVAVRKKAGRLGNLVADLKAKPMPEATVGIGHTRWATNGEPTDVNAHPHISRDGKVALIHNGIIENASRLRLDLETEGYTFVSSTDTEVTAKLLGKIAQEIIDATGQPDIFEAIRRLARMLKGTFTILAVDSRQPDLVVGIRHGKAAYLGCRLDAQGLAKVLPALLEALDVADMRSAQGDPDLLRVERVSQDDRTRFVFLFNRTRHPVQVQVEGQVLVGSLTGIDKDGKQAILQVNGALVQRVVGHRH